MDGLSILKRNIQAYLRRFYFGQIVSGILITSGIVGLLWIFISLLEYFFRFGTQARMILFYGFDFIALGLIAIQVLIPVLRMLGIIQQKSSQQAAKEIGSKIDLIDDRLVNVLSLESALDNRDDSLTMAGLMQKASQLNGIDFSQAVDLKASFWWLRVTLIPLILFLLVFMWNSSAISESTERLVEYNKSFVPPAPFSFVLSDDNLTVAEGESFQLVVTTQGKSIPDIVFVEVDGTEFRMKALPSGEFTHYFNNVRSDKTFRLRGASVYSEYLELKAIPKPKVLRNEAYLDYPDYTGKKNETLLNRSQLIIPEGTNVKWLVNIANASSNLVLMDGLEILTEDASGGVLFDGKFINSKRISISLAGASGLVDSAQILVNVLKDQSPVIEVNERSDSLTGNHYFQGSIGDDYGFSGLRFVAQVKGTNSFLEPIEIQKDRQEQAFVFAWSSDSLLDNPGDEIVYFFEVSDNDGVNGAKTTRSKTWALKVPTQEELIAESAKRTDKTKSSLSNSSSELDQMKKEMEELRKNILEKKKPDWQDREALKEMLDKQKEMMEELQQKAQEQNRQFQQEERFQKYSEELMNKQEMIQEMFDELFDEEFKEKYEEYNRLLDEMNKNQMLEQLEKMSLDNEMLEKQMDRTLELFKQLEFEKKVEENLERLNELIDDQAELNEKTEQKSRRNDDLAKEQEDLENRTEQLKQSLEDMEEMNESLEEPTRLPETDSLAKDTKDKMSEAKDELNKGNQGKAKKNQSEASEGLQEMKDKLDDFKKKQEQTQQAENLEDMRQLLENILDLSVNQEKVMLDLKPIKGSDPKFVALTKEQKSLVDDTKIVEDSLLALSKRVPQIDKVINDEITSVKFNMAKSLSFMSDQPPNREDQYKAMTVERQQYAMTSLNNLALLFEEIIDNMQMQMAPKSKGSGSCDKPGSGKGSKPSAAEMKKMQENLNKQLEKLKEALEKGENPNGKRPGEKPGEKQGASGMGGSAGMSKQMAQMAAQQAAIRKQLREMSESLNNDGSGSGNSLKEIEKLMEQTEEDILFQKIDAETMRRQQDILNKLLESDNADREREFEERRTSNSSQSEFVIPEDIWNRFEIERSKELEMYKTVPPSLKPFYRKEVNRYFSNFQNK